jgi:hypothetical protein
MVLELWGHNLSTQQCGPAIEPYPRELCGVSGSRAFPELYVRAPPMGEMREREWLHWGYLHTDHHLRQFAV